MGNNYNYIAYLFATCAGVTKVGTVSVSGATDVDCGFSSGARLLLIKRYDGSGNWIFSHNASGFPSGNNRYRTLNVSANPVTNADIIDPLNAGFTLTSNFTGVAGGNGNYVFLAVA